MAREQIPAHVKRAVAAPLLPTAAAILFLALLSPASRADQPPVNPEWVGGGSCRLLVRVPPRNLGTRPADEMPARIRIQAVKLPLQISRLDVDSIQVIRYHPDTGKPLPAAKFAYGKSQLDIPFRWYDAAIPDPFPEVAEYADRDDTFPRVREALWGHRYNVAGDWKSGSLAWIHRQEADKPSCYAVYFDPLPEEKRIETNPRCGWIGDRSLRFAPLAYTTTSQIHTRVALADWDGDGLTDILAGFASGGLLVYPNLGDKSNPKFTIARMIFQDGGLPLDNGGQTAPLVVDWDGDGRQDLIVGTEWNRQLFYRNTGTNADPKLRFHSFLQADGQILAVPHAPSPETEPHFTYQRDYYAIWEACDWDGDGDLDLLGGGYVTGRVFFYENTGRTPGGLPALHYRGPILADGEPLDVTWGASPCVADFDGDGDLDLMSGCMLMVKGGDAAAGDLLLRYWENVGTPTNPQLALRPFPKNVHFPRGQLLATSRAADLNRDGLLDLVVSTYNGAIFIWPNIGTRTRPLFDVRSSCLVPSGFGAMPIPGVNLTDLDADGQPDILAGYGYYKNRGKGSPGLFDSHVPIVRGPGRISHPSPHGDQYSFIWFADLNGDQRLDCLVGDHGGNVWFHRQLEADGQFDIPGVKLAQTDGQPIRVGQTENTEGFDVLQGARTAIATGDMDLDGRPDLVVGDTHGKVRYYRHAGGSPVPLFEPPVLVGTAPTSVTRPCVADWDGDGRPDILVPASQDSRLWLNRAKAGAVTFVVGANPLPRFPPGAVALGIVDFNGDGDADIIAQNSYNYCFFIERSFLKHGYAQAEMIAAQKK